MFSFNECAQTFAMLNVWDRNFLTWPLRVGISSYCKIHNRLPRRTTCRICVYNTFFIEGDTETLSARVFAVRKKNRRNAVIQGVVVDAVVLVELGSPFALRR